MTGILDGDGDLIPDPADIDVTGGVDSDGDGVDDLFDVSLAGASYKGDHDDVWMGTVRAQGQPFRGRYIAPNTTMTVNGTDYPTLDLTALPATAVIESPIAEVVWWTALHDDSDFVNVDEFDADSITVYRRALLIRPDGGLVLPTFLTFRDAAAYLATNDICARVVFFNDGGTDLYSVVANEVKELANRQNRFCHIANPNAFDATWGSPRRLLNRGDFFPSFVGATTSGLWGLRSADYLVDTAGTYSLVYNGNDILLTDVAAFDLKVYSPNASVGIAGGVTIEPHDIGYGATLSPAPVYSALGGYVDLGHAGGGWFSGYSTPLSQLTYQYRIDKGAAAFRNGLVETVYDTWTPLYESDGLNQDGDNTGGTTPVAIIDEGTNGINDAGGGTAAPDDDGERETRPPYPFPVRGIKATIRLVEKNTKQIHQSSVIHSYVPE